MMAFVWLFTAMLIAGAGVPLSAVLLAKLGLIHPFFVIAFGRRWDFDPWALFAAQQPKTFDVSVGNFVSGLPAQHAAAANVAVTILCVNMLVNQAGISIQPRVLGTSKQTISNDHNSTEGMFAVSNA